MADLAFADKRIQATKISNNPSQLPVDAREMYKKLKALSLGKEFMPMPVKVSTLSGRMRPLLRANRYEDEIATAVEEDLLPSMFDGGTAEDTRTSHKQVIADTNRVTSKESMVRKRASAESES
jgi:hypothetical protein